MMVVIGFFKGFPAIFYTSNIGDFGYAYNEY